VRSRYHSADGFDLLPSPMDSPTDSRHHLLLLHLRACADASTNNNSGPWGGEGGGSQQSCWGSLRVHGNGISLLAEYCDTRIYTRTKFIIYNYIMKNAKSKSKRCRLDLRPELLEQRLADTDDFLPRVLDKIEDADLKSVGNMVTFTKFSRSVRWRGFIERGQVSTRLQWQRLDKNTMTLTKCQYPISLRP
jgi:hypothetical protein